MAELYHVYVPKKVYWDKQTFSSLEEQIDSTKGSATLYIGNMSFFTTETQVHELFSSVGHVKRIIMGLDRNKKTPCGFCFVEYDAKQEAMYAVNYISGTKLDGRVIRCELDAGFREGRQYGRGNSGGQVRDERRSKDDYDAGRGGYGKADIDEAMFAQRPYRRRGRRHGNSFDKPYAKRHRGSSIDEFNGDNHAPSSEVPDRSTAPASDVAPPSPMKDVSKDNAEENQKDADVNPRFRDD